MQFARGSTHKPFGMLLLVMCGIIACATLSTGARAQPLPAPLHRVGATTNVHGGEGYEGVVPQNLAVDWVGQRDQYHYSMQGTAQTFGGLSPLAAAQAEASAGTANYYFYIRTSASIDYYVRVSPRGTPPPGNYAVPARAQVRGEAHGFAFSQVRIGYLPPFTANTVAPNEFASYDVSVPLAFTPSNPELNVTLVRLRADASGYHARPGWASSSQAYADPVFTFDQAAFDQQQGANTFPLADYFEFEYSEYLVNPPALPTITMHPQGQTRCEGESVTFSAAADSTVPMTYQWRLDGAPLTDGNGFTGTTTPTLGIDPVQASCAGNYDCVFTNPAGSVATNPAPLVVKTPVTITYPPQPVTVPGGQPMSMMVFSSGSEPRTFQWRKNGQNLIDDGRISGTTTDTLSIDPTVFSDAGSFDVVISNVCNASTSDAATLTVTGCAADFNADGSADFFDYLDFVALYSIDDPLADFNGDFVVDFFDYLDFVAAFSIGC